MSRKRIHRYTLSTTASTRPMLANSGSSSARPKARLLCQLSKIVIASPTAIAETQNSNGRIGVYHSG